MRLSSFLDSVFENNPLLRKDAYNIFHTLKNAGFEIYLIGGCVRDLILNKVPHDWDFVTSAKPEEIQKLFSDYSLVGNSFGVSLVKFGDRTYEIATYRTESNYTDGRRPDEISFTPSLEEDIKRRDFTINGIAYDLTVDKIIDYHNGVSDISNKIIRTIGKPRDRFKEDYLRVLRAYRFAITLGFDFDPATKESADYHFKTALNIISGERIQGELKKIFFRDEKVVSLKHLDYSFFSKFFGGLKRNFVLGDKLTYFELFCLRIYQFCFHTFVIKNELGIKLKFSSKEIARIIRILKRLCDIGTLSFSEDTKIYEIKELQFEEDFEIIRNIAEAQYGPITFTIKPFSWFRKKFKLNELKKLDPEKRLITGQDLIDLKITNERKTYSKLLYRIYSLQIGRSITSKEKMLKFVKKAINKKSNSLEIHKLYKYIK